MSPLELKASLIAPDFAEFKKVGISRAFTHAAHNALGKFIDKELPKRFDGQKTAELGFSLRDPDYIEKAKRRLKKPYNYHNFSGKTRKAVLGSATVKVVNRRNGTSRMSITFTGLGPQYAKRRKPGKLNLHNELSRVSQREAAAIMEHAAQAFVDYLRNNPKAIKKRRNRP